MSPVSIEALLKGYAPFSDLEPEAFQHVVSHAEHRVFPAGSVVVGPDTGEPQFLYILASGRVEVTETGDPGSVPWVLEVGQSFPIGALSGRRVSANIYTAVSDCAFWLLPADAFHHLMANSGVFSRHCGSYLSKLLSQSRRSIQARYAHQASEQQPLATELGKLIKRSPVFITANTPILRALETMAESGIGSIVVVGEEGEQPIGILTQSDVLKRIVLPRVPLEKPIGGVMSGSPVTMLDTAYAYDAVLAMVDKGVRHVIVVGDDGRLRGVVSERDLFALQRLGAGQLRRALEAAAGPEEVTRVLQDVRQYALNMLAQGVGAEQLTRFISALNDAASRRLVELRTSNVDLSDLEWSWLAFGSEGREEQTFSTDQDNGIVFVCREGADVEEARQRLLIFARLVNADLDQCGFPLCKGQIMAGNPEWCLTLDEWRRKFSKWIREPVPQALLNASIFFDFRAIFGKLDLADAMHMHLLGLSQANMAFQRMLAGNALTVSPPLGTFRDFVTEQGENGTAFIDLKTRGARLFVDAARVLALSAGIDSANTVTRLRRVAAVRKQSREETEAIIEAFTFIQMLRLHHQEANAKRGEATDNRLVPGDLHQLDRRILKEAFRQAKTLQLRLKVDYQL